jgi:hypothetical protein
MADSMLQWLTCDAAGELSRHPNMRHTKGVLLKWEAVEHATTVETHQTLLRVLLLPAQPSPPIPSSRHRVCCCWPTWPLPAFLASGTSSRPRLVPLDPDSDTAPLAAPLLLLLPPLTAPGTCCALCAAAGLLLLAAFCFLAGCALLGGSCCFFCFPACRCGA